MNPTLESVLTHLGAARRFAEPNLPKGKRLMAARGTLPLPPDQMLALLFALSLDTDEEVHECAERSLEALPERVVDAALDAPLHPALLHRLALGFQENDPRLEKIALNPATSDETFCWLASLPNRSLVELVSHNQVRLLRCPRLFEALGENPLMSPAAIDRVLEFLGISADKPPPEPSDARQSTSGDKTTPGALADEDRPDGPTISIGDSEKAVSLHGPEKKTREGSLFHLIQEMSIIDKVKLARFGNKEARALLVRDRNRIIASAAIRSPKVKDTEALAIAQSRNVSEEVLRIIAGTREWTRSYPIQLALATNPKTPLTAAIKFLNYLADRDLKSIMRSRDVPAPVTQQARRILARKGKH